MTLKDIRLLEASSLYATLPTWHRAMRSQVTHNVGAPTNKTIIRSVFGQNLKTMGQECVYPRISSIAGIRQLWISDSFLTPSMNNVFQVVNLQRTLSNQTGASGINAIHPLRLVDFKGIVFNGSATCVENLDSNGVTYDININITLGRRGLFVSSNATALQLLINTTVSCLFRTNQGVLYFVGGTAHRLVPQFTLSSGEEAGEESGFNLTLTAKSTTPILIASPILLAPPQFNVPVPGSLFGNIISVQTACTLPLGASSLTTESALPFPTNPAACSVLTYARP